MKASIENYKKGEMFLRGVVAGLGWAIGVTIGFAIVSAIIALVVKNMGGASSIGEFFASILQNTQDSLLNKNPIIGQ